MKLASFPKFALLALLAGVFALALNGCGASNNLALTPGNWSITATPTAAANIANSNFDIGGNLTQNGSSLAGTMSVVGSPNCFAPSQTVTFTGTVKGTNVTLTSESVGGEVITITATGTNGSLTGTYSIAGGTVCDGQKGTITASPVPSVSATWSGPIVGDANGDPKVTLAIAFTQAATASADGTFALTGNITYTGSTCSHTGTIPANSSFIVGPYVVVNNATTDDGATFSYTALLDNAASPTSMPGGTYQTTGGACEDLLSVTLTKQ
jgi:hypothetical protein